MSAKAGFLLPQSHPKLTGTYALMDTLIALGAIGLAALVAFVAYRNIPAA